MRYFLFVVLFSVKIFAALDNPLVDEAGLIPADKKILVEQTLRELRTNKDIWLVVWTIPTLNGKTLEDTALKQFEKWQIGEKGKDNGLLLLIAAEERKMRMEVGYGLEGDFPDIRVKQLLDDIIRPSLKDNDLASGILNLISTITNAPQANTKVETQFEELKREDVLKTLSPQVIDLTNSLDAQTLNYFNNQIQWKREEGVDFWLIVGHSSERDGALKLVSGEKPHRVVLFLDLEAGISAVLNKPDFGSAEEWLKFDEDMNSRLKVAHPINALGGSNGEFKMMLWKQESELENLKRDEASNRSEKIFIALIASVFLVITFILGRKFYKRIPILESLSIASQAKLDIGALLAKYATLFTFTLPIGLLILCGLLLAFDVSGLSDFLKVFTVLSSVGSVICALNFQYSVARKLLAMNLKPEEKSLVLKHFGDPTSRSSGGSESSGSGSSSSSSRSSSSSYSGGGRSGGGGANSSW